MDIKRKTELIQELAEICRKLDWVIALPTEQDTVPGLIVGTEEFVAEVVQVYYGPDYEIFTQDPMTDELQEVPQPPIKKGTTVH